MLSLSVCYLAAKNLHDPLLLPTVQTMYCKLILNFSEMLVTKDNEQDEPVYCNFSMQSLLRPL